MKKLIEILCAAIGIITISLFILFHYGGDIFVAGGSTTIDAKMVGDTPSNSEKLFSYNGNIIAYCNVYKDGNEFVICDGGYIKSINGRVDYLMRFNDNDSIKVYKCDIDGNFINQKEEAKEFGIIDGDQAYLLADCSNFYITNESNDGTEINIGTIFFWC